MFYVNVCGLKPTALDGIRQILPFCGRRIKLNKNTRRLADGKQSGGRKKSEDRSE
jgi:hypothetical protein